MLNIVFYISLRLAIAKLKELNQSIYLTHADMPAIFGSWMVLEAFEDQTPTLNKIYLKVVLHCRGMIIVTITATY